MNICENCNRPIESKYFPTEKEKIIINFILNYQEINKKTPSFREMLPNVGLKSTASVYRYLHKLENKGFLSIIPGEYRSITILKRID
tara:strand:+ start:734 stop:994 length:261 start_codon:yes stop_codon:yes gene_type:complete